MTGKVHDSDGFDVAVDLLVFGSGAAGLSAALFAEINGLKSLLCEKSDCLGGTTASSGGIFWIPGNPHADAHSDTSDAARDYLKSELGNNYRSDLAEAFLESAPAAIERLESESDVKFHAVPWPDYHCENTGGVSSGRTIEAERFDARKLGDDFGLVQPPYPFLMLFGGMHVDKRKVDTILNPFRSVGNFLQVMGMFLRYGMDRLKYERGTDIGAGNALVARYLYSLRHRKADIWTNAPLKELIVENRRVTGAIVTREGRTLKVGARYGVVLATGGFAHNEQLRDELSAQFPHEISFASPGNTGDGISAGRVVGGAIDSDLGSSGYWQPASGKLREDGTFEGVMYGYLDRGRPGVIAVDKDGRRFVNEANSYHDVAMAMFGAGFGKGNYFHFVCDREFVWHHGLGKIRPFRRSLRKHAETGYVTVADTLESLAEKIAVDPNGLMQTVERHNRFCVTGIDEDFGKGSTTYNRQFAHSRAKPNGNLAPIAKPPFVALKIYPATLGTAVGLDTDKDGRVRDRNGHAIEGLYACGNDGASVMRGNYPSGGITLGPAIAFAYRIAEHARRKKTTADVHAAGAPNCRGGDQ